MGPHTNEVLVGKAIKGIPREKVQLATKFGSVISVDGQFCRRGDPEWVRESCDGSLKRLGVDYIDLYYQHRLDPTVPIEIIVGEMKKLVEEGKVKHLGLSETSASEICCVHKVHPIAAVRAKCIPSLLCKWSGPSGPEIWKRTSFLLAELGIALVPYSPLGRGFFAGYKPGAENQDSRNFQPRFSGKNLEKNEVLWAQVEPTAAKKGCSLNQLAHAWVLHNGKDVVPIPGTTKKANLESKIGTVADSLSKEEIKEIEAAVPISEVAGDRYHEDCWSKRNMALCQNPTSFFMERLQGGIEIHNKTNGILFCFCFQNAKLLQNHDFKFHDKSNTIGKRVAAQN